MSSGFMIRTELRVCLVMVRRMPTYARANDARFSTVFHLTGELMLSSTCCVMALFAATRGRVLLGLRGKTRTVNQRERQAPEQIRGVQNARRQIAIFLNCGTI